MDDFRERQANERRRMGLALKALRQRLGVSQGAAAAAAGFSDYKAWQNYEAGNRNISVPKLNKLLEALNADREEFEEQLARLPDAEAQLAVRTRSLEERSTRPYTLPFAGLAHGGPLRPNVFDGRDDEAVSLERFFAPGTRILRLEGMSMYPYAEPGGFVTYNPNQPARRGHGCVVEQTDGARLVKRFERYTEDSVIVTELYPVEREMQIPLRDVVGVYAIGLRGD